MLWSQLVFAAPERPKKITAELCMYVAKIYAALKSDILTGILPPALCSMPITPVDSVASLISDAAFTAVCRCVSVNTVKSHLQSVLPCQ